LSAQEITIPGEDPDDLNKLHAEFTESCKPANGMEAHLVRQITLAAWRLRRSDRIEAQLFTAETPVAQLKPFDRAKWREEVEAMTDRALVPYHEDSEEEEVPEETSRSEVPPEGEFPPSAPKNSSAQDRPPPETGQRKRQHTPDVGSVFRRLTATQDPITQLLRYETSAERSYYRALLALERLQATRKGTHTLPPDMIEGRSSVIL
jgi:hypothetical protein